MWSSYREQPDVRDVAIEVRQERDGLMVEPATLFVTFKSRGGGLVHSDEVPWDAELEEWLIDVAKAHATSEENEKLRFALLLKPKLLRIVSKYGDGYFNAVFVRLVRSGPLSRHPQVAAALRSIHEAAPYGENSRRECEEWIEQAIRGIASKIALLYPEQRAVAEDILGGAIAQYLDERYSITNRKLLGLE